MPISEVYNMDYDMGFDFYGTELDKDYFEAMDKRFIKYENIRAM